MRIHHNTGWYRGLLALALVSALGGPATAQWFSVPIPGTPRTGDGKPDLKAPPPRTAGKIDLTGFWVAAPGSNQLLPRGVEAPFLPWAEELYKKRVDTRGYDVPMTHCLPHGVPDAMLVAQHPFKIVQTPNVVLHLYEEFTAYRQIHTDGRKLPVDPNPTWYGYSVGRWDDDAFVVESAGFKEGSWLTNRGHMHTDALRTTERFRRASFGSMTLDVTIDDPKAYSRPWSSAAIQFSLMPDTELLEHLCENNRDVTVLRQIWAPASAPTTAK